MTIGTGLFLSSLFLGTVALYIATKDRWNWKKIFLWPVVGLVAVGAVIGVGVWAWSEYQSRPQPLTEISGIRLQMPAEEVKFRKGVPSQESISRDKSRFVWEFKTKDNDVHLVGFDEGRVRFVGYAGESYRGPSITGIYSKATPEEIERVYGPPSFVSSSKDGLSRILNFANYNVFAELNASGVYFYGIFDPAKGPVRFAEE